LPDIPERSAGQLPTLEEPARTDFNRNFADCVDEIRRSDVVFPALHGSFGEDGSIQGLFELLDVAYVGSGVLASAACMDKPTTKAMLQVNGIQTPAFAHVDLRDRSSESVKDAIAQIAASKLAYPMFVKPARSGSSLGMSKVTDAEGLTKAINAAAEHDLRLIFEQAITGMREIECGVMANPHDEKPIASLPSEIRVKPPHEFYDFTAKYLDDSADLIVPADLTPATVSRVQELALQVFDVMGCESLARVDFFLKGNEIFVNEINTMPGFTSISMFPRMFAASGVSYDRLVDDLVLEARSRFVR
jgi:D-alanine-D-alanine ligase